MRGMTRMCGASTSVCAAAAQLEQQAADTRGLGGSGRAGRRTGRAGTMGAEDLRLLSTLRSATLDDT